MRTKNLAFCVAAGLVLAAGMWVPSNARAGVNVNIGINLAPPAYVIHEPPPVVVIPGSYVYFVPGIQLDILFYRGDWYRPYEGRWYRGRSYNGPWQHISAPRVPSAILHLPPDYRRARHAYRSIPYGQMERNWRTWERERYWDRREMRHDREKGREDNEYGRSQHSDRDRRRARDD
jgi:hypothetical protein